MNSPSQLATLASQISPLLALSRQQSQRHKLLPAINALSNKLLAIYQHEPTLMAWVLNGEFSNLNYSSALTLKRLTCICALCHALGYRSTQSKVMLVASLISILACYDLIEKKSQGESLTPPEQQRWLAQSQLGLKIAHIEPAAHPTLTQIVAKLTRYQYQISAAASYPLYDGYTRLVALAHLLAEPLCSKAHRQAKHLYLVIAHLYQRTTHLKVKSQLRLLHTHLGEQLAGSVYYHQETPYCYLLKHPEKGSLLMTLNSEKSSIKSIKNPQWDFQQPLLKHSDINALQRFLLLPNELQTSKQASVKPLIKNGFFRSLVPCQSYQEIEQLLTPYPQLHHALISAAALYNRGAKPPQTLRHVLSMIGLANAANFITRVTLQQQFSELAHPLSSFIRARVLSCLAIARQVVKDTPHQIEPLASVLLCYFNYFVSQQSHCISRSYALQSPSSSRDAPFAYLIGITDYSHSELHHYLQQTLGTNPWITPLLNSEQQPLNAPTEQSLIINAIRELSLASFSTQQSLSSTQFTRITAPLANSQQIALPAVLDSGIYNGL